MSILNAFNGFHGKISIVIAGPAVALAAVTFTAAGPAFTANQSSLPQRAGGVRPAQQTAVVLPMAVAGGGDIRRSSPADAATAHTGTRTGVVDIALASASFGGSVTLTVRRHGWRHRTPRQIARWLLVHRFHWRRWQFKYLNRLWDRESGWNSHARNPYSGAYGIPQAVPASKMASAGPDWQSSARTQIRWGMRYIRARYRSPYLAWQHECAYGWY